MLVRLLTVKDLAALLQINERTCWRLAREAELGVGYFPMPIRITPRTIRWRSSDVEAYLARIPADKPQKRGRN